MLDLAQQIDRIYLEFVNSSAEYHRKLGELLNQVKEDEAHGTFEDWVKKHCRFSLTTAWNCRKVADHWPECQEYMKHRLEANLQRAEDFSFRGFEKWLKERKNASDDTKKLPRKKSSVESKAVSNKNLKAAQRMVSLVCKSFNGIRIPKPSSLDPELMKYLDQVPYQLRLASVRHTNEPVECPTCSGTGSTDGNSDCSQCAGSGVIVSIKLS